MPFAECFVDNLEFFVVKRIVLSLQNIFEIVFEELAGNSAIGDDELLGGEVRLEVKMPTGKIRKYSL